MLAPVLIRLIDEMLILRINRRLQILPQPRRLRHRSECPKRQMLSGPQQVSRTLLLARMHGYLRQFRQLLQRLNHSHRQARLQSGQPPQVLIRLPQLLAFVVLPVVTM